MGDEAVPVCPLTRLASEVLLEIGQRTVGAEREHDGRENHGGKVCPHEPRPPPRQEPAGEKEGDERGMRDGDKVGGAYVQHWPLHARRSVRAQGNDGAPEVSFGQRRPSRIGVTALETQWIEAFNTGDAAGVARFYAENARILPPNDDVVQGRAGIEGFVKEFLQMKPTISFSLLTVHESPEMCASVGALRHGAPAAGRGNAEGLGEVHRDPDPSADGSWLIEDDIFNSNLPAPPV